MIHKENKCGLKWNVNENETHGIVQNAIEKHQSHLLYVFFFAFQVTKLMQHLKKEMNKTKTQHCNCSTNSKGNKTAFALKVKKLFFFSCGKWTRHGHKV